MVVFLRRSVALIIRALLALRRRFWETDNSNPNVSWANELFPTPIEEFANQSKPVAL